MKDGRTPQSSSTGTHTHPSLVHRKRIIRIKSLRCPRNNSCAEEVLTRSFAFPYRSTERYNRSFKCRNFEAEMLLFDELERNTDFRMIFSHNFALWFVCRVTVAGHLRQMVRRPRHGTKPFSDTVYRYAIRNRREEDEAEAASKGTRLLPP